MIFQPRDDLVGDGRLESGHFIGREGDEEVGLNGAVDPRVHAGAEGINHDGHTDGHGNGGHECGGGQRVAVHGSDQIARGKTPRGAAGEKVDERGDETSGRGRGGGDEEGEAYDDKKRGGEPEQGRAGVQREP